VHGYSLLRPQLNKDYFHELYDAAEEFGIEIEGHHTETGPGVFETVRPALPLPSFLLPSSPFCSFTRRVYG
jgi:hypothetical protein